MLVDLSNKLPTSSHHSSISSSEDDLPGLIAVKECLPTFAEAATANLPHHIVTTEDDPPSFCLSVTNQEAEQEFPPISPQMAEVLLCTPPDINNAIHAIAFRLIATIRHHTLAASQELDQSRVHKQQLQSQIAF